MDQALAAVDLGGQQTAAKRLSTSAQREATRKPYEGDLVPGSLVQWSDSGGLRADIYSTSSLLQYASAGRRCIHPRRCGQVQLIAALLYAADHPACSWTK